MRLHQVLVAAAAGDAVTGAALGLQAGLRTMGESEVFARHVEPAVAGRVAPLADYARRVGAGSGDDVLVVHASIGEPEVEAFLASRPERIVLVYHNISPAGLFREVDPAFAGLLEAGRREVAALRPRVALAVADSPFNARDLEAMGYRDVRVCPPALDPAALVEVEPDPATAHHLAAEVRGPVVLYVGQLLPHKRPDLLVAAFHVLTTYLDPEAHLILVGPARLRRYRSVVQSFVEELSLPRAWVAGAVPASALAAFYRRADVFATASEHEGFCVPVLEAMAFGRPVVARGHAALPDTVGGAGVVLPAGAGPVLMAEAVHACLHDTALREALVERGRRRVAEFDPERSVAAMLGHLAGIA